MGYSCRYEGEVTVTPDLTLKDYNYLKGIASGKVREQGMPDTVHCDVVPTEQGSALQWAGSEKSYQMFEWMAYIVAQLDQRGYACSGHFTEYDAEQGASPPMRINVEGNTVSRQQARLVWD